MTEPNYRLGGYIQGSVSVHLFEGESIVDRHGKVVATVINGELIRVSEGNDDKETFVMIPKFWQELKERKGGDP